MSEDFRARARAWLAANAPRRGAADDEAEAETRGQDAVIAAQKAFQAKLYDAGFAGLTWPKEYGGQGLTNAEQIAFGQEARDYALPVGVFFIGLGMPGRPILELGTEEQKQRYLPKMLRGEEIWCQLFSEPGAGSDVASPARPARCGTATSGCSTGRRCGRRARSTATTARSSRGPTRRCPSTTASRCSSSTCTPPA